MEKVLLAQSGFTDAPAKISQLDLIFENLFFAAGGAAGLILFVIIIVSGFEFITSGGEPGKVEKAKNTFTWAVYGFIFISISILILGTIEVLTGVTFITSFSIFQK